MFLRLLLLPLLLPFPLLAQNTFEVTWVIQKQPSAWQDSSEIVLQIGNEATITLPTKGDTYVWRAEAGAYTYTVSSQYYHTLLGRFTLRRDTVITVSLKVDPEQAVYTLPTTTITDNKTRQQLERMAGVERMTIDEVRKRPSLLGEPDALRAIQYIAGVGTGGEGASGYFVRGGSHDQNLFLWDNIPLYNVSHMLGLMSVFNPDVVQAVTLYKGAFPARYGGRLSSVIDVDSRPGRTDRVHGSGGIGLISSRLTLEGPLKVDSAKEQYASWLIAGRRTYADIFTRFINGLNSGNEDYKDIPNYYFHDFNGRIQWISGREVFNLTAYNGTDFLSFPENDGLDYRNQWTNTGIGFQWRHPVGEKNALYTNLSHTGFRYQIGSETADYNLLLRSRIADYTAQLRIVQENKDKKLRLEAGAYFTHRNTTPQLVHTVIGALEIDHTSAQKIQAQEWGAFGALHFQPVKYLRTDAGLRMAGYSSGNMRWLRPEPRLNINLDLNDKTVLKTAYSRMHQFMHLVSNGMASLPTDVWYPVVAGLPPQRADQISGGLHRSLNKEKWLVSVEGFYKWIKGAVEYAEGAEVLFQPDFASQMVIGKGWAYGGELQIEKLQGKVTGSVAYTLAWAKRQFEKKNLGRAYFASFDRRHNLIASAFWHISDRVELGLAWTYASGNPVTLPVARYFSVALIPDGFGGFGHGYNVVYTGKNTYRMPAFHHLDASFTWHLKTKKPNRKSSLNLSVYNLYNRRNPFYIHVKVIREPGSSAHRGYEISKTSLFPIIPTISYQFRF